MRRKTLPRAGNIGYELTNRPDSADFRVTPSMRRKVDDLAVWLTAGDRSKIPGATRLVIELLCFAFRPN